MVLDNQQRLMGGVRDQRLMGGVREQTKVNARCQRTKKAHRDGFRQH